MSEEKAINKQVGGDHYQGFAIPPAEYNQKNNIPFMEASAIKYVSRHRLKGTDEDGRQDLEKAKHCIDMAIEHYYSK